MYAAISDIHKDLLGDKTRNMNLDYIIEALNAG